MTSTTVTPLNLSGPNTATTTGVAVNSADISYTYGGGLTAIGTSHSTFGSGYSGAIVTISGGGGSGAIATAVVSGGAIASFAVVCPGTGYTSTPTVKVYGTALSGTTITAVFNVAYSSSNPTYWNLNLTASVAAPANNTGGSRRQGLLDDRQSLDRRPKRRERAGRRVDRPDLGHSRPTTTRSRRSRPRAARSRACCGSWM